KPLTDRISFSEQIFSVQRNMAGSDDERLESLVTALNDSDIDYLWAIRGGHGALRILDRIPTTLNCSDKILIGYSDITAYQWFFYKTYGMKSIAGPMIQVDFSKEYRADRLKFLWDLINKSKSTFPLDKSIKTHNYRSIEAPLIGGCLSIICRLCGTPYMPDLNGHILFLEDVNEEIYRIDSMLAQLKLNGLFRQIKGVILGQFSFSSDKENQENELLDLYRDYFWDLDIPVIYNFPHGHIDQLVPLPIGYHLRLGENELEFTR
ncbi:MAG: LD-carboxypeptidase, partial [Calditrichaeota bacterium]|nr:LD-carboxypeptidase [Calditrichota bacterium]